MLAKTACFPGQVGHSLWLIWFCRRRSRTVFQSACVHWLRRARSVGSPFPFLLLLSLSTSWLFLLLFVFSRRSGFAAIWWSSSFFSRCRRTIGFGFLLFGFAFLLLPFFFLFAFVVFLSFFWSCSFFLRSNISHALDPFLTFLSWQRRLVPFFPAS